MVLDICRPIAAEPENETSDETPDNSKFGYVYLIKSGKHHKVGHSNSAGRREYELSVQLPERATTVHTISTDDPVGIEADWHKRFEAKRLNGEWFNCRHLSIQTPQIHVGMLHGSWESDCENRSVQFGISG